MMTTKRRPGSRPTTIRSSMGCARVKLILKRRKVAKPRINLSVSHCPLTSSQPTSSENHGRSCIARTWRASAWRSGGGDSTHKETFAPRSCYQSPPRRNEHFRDFESSLGHCILVDLAILHNDQKVFVGIFDELDIFQRISIDQQQISKCAFLHNTKLARIGIDKSGECH